MRLFAFLLLLGISPSPVFSQNRFYSSEKDTTKFNNRQYKQELGIAVHKIFKGELGGSLVWKIRDDRSKLVPVSYSNYWRFQAGLSGSEIKGTRDTLYFTDYTIERNIPDYKSHNFWARIGKERNNFSNRYNFYYGWEFGPDFVYEENSNRSFTTVYSINDPIPLGFSSLENTSRKFSVGAGGAVFVGVKYHFTPRISLSFESSFSLFAHFIRTEDFLIFRGEIQKREAKWTYDFAYSLAYLRFVTLNYHFRQY